MAVFDSTTLLYLLDPDAKAPTDVLTGQPVADANARIDAFVASLQDRQEAVLVPTPVLSEVLVHAGDAAPSYLDILANTSRFRVVSFDEKSGDRTRRDDTTDA